MRFSWRLVIDVVAPAFFTCWIVLLGYDALAGATGVRALKRLEAEAAAKSAEVERLAGERQRLERVAAQLNPKSLDADMADEKIRAVLGYVEEGDVVIVRRELDAVIGRKAGG